MTRAGSFTVDKLAWIERVSADAGLSPLAARLCSLLATRFLNRETGTAWPSQSTLFETLGIGETTLKRVIREARDRGHLRVTVSAGRGRASVYSPGPGPEKGATDGPLLAGKRVDQRPLIEADKGPSAVGKRVRRRPPNLMKEPSERIAALSPDDEIEADRIFSSLPKACASRSNRALVRGAVASLISEGLQAKALRIAVAAFVSTSPDAIDKGGRFMGPAHTWLTNKRGWEAFAPSADDLFLDGRRNGDNEWLHRVRLWQRFPDAWRHKRDEWGPEPDHKGSRVPSEILTHCEVAPAGLECSPVDRRV